jgi:N-acetylglucosaminyldiphosphoundecaprenol N-acetyl-beta-D-mannosaminyltransferase
MNSKRVELGKITLDTYTHSQLMQLVQKSILAKRSTLLVTPYSEMIVYTEKDDELTTAINKADYIVADGIGVLWGYMYLWSSISFIHSLWRIPNRHIDLYQTFPEQIRGSELLPELFDYAQKERLRVYLLGGSEATHTRIKTILNDSYPQIVLAGSLGTKIQSISDAEQAFQDISDLHVDLVIVSLSTPIQEKIGLALREKLRSDNQSGVVCCLGGSLDLMAGMRNSPPPFVRKLGIEWAWRFLIQPSRFRRVIRASIEFPLLIARYKHKK